MSESGEQSVVSAEGVARPRSASGRSSRAAPRKPGPTRAGWLSRTKSAAWAVHVVKRSCLADTRLAPHRESATASAAGLRKQPVENRGLLAAPEQFCRRCRCRSSVTGPATRPPHHVTRSDWTSSRARGATSWPKRFRSAGSSEARMNPDTPYRRARSAICSAQSPGVPCNRPPPAPDVNQPLRLSRRLIAAGSRPAAEAASSICWFIARSDAGPSGRNPREGSQPSAILPVSRSMRGL